jgi:DNA-binding transcriptional LysR family regulator
LAEAVADIYGLKHYPVPFEVPPVPTYLIWHPSRRNDPAHRWLREQCLSVAEGLQQRECPGSPAAA